MSSIIVRLDVSLCPTLPPSLKMTASCGRWAPHGSETRAAWRLGQSPPRGTLPRSQGSPRGHGCISPALASLAFAAPQTRTLLVATEAGRSHPIPSGRVCTVAGRQLILSWLALPGTASSSWPGTSTEGRPSNAKQAHLSRDRCACLMDDHARGRHRSRHADN
jgi:hypothetical protein